MKKTRKLLLFIMVFCLLMLPALAATNAVQQTLYYRDISINIDGEQISAVDINGNTVEPFILDGTTYIPARATFEALGYDVEWNDATSTIDISSSRTLKVGAGVGTIDFPQAMFPIEGFSGEYVDDIHARVLVIKNDTKVAIVSLEMVNVPEDIVELCKQAVYEATGTAKDNIWVHATHAITTPHAPTDPDAHALYVTAISNAITTAAKQAADSYQPAVMGVGTGTCDVNANRDIELNGQWYYGLDSTMTSNKTMTVLRFDAVDGSPIGFFVSYGIKPTCIDNVEMADNTRKLSADVPGYASVIMEEEFDAPVVFCMPAAGDQIPAEIANYYILGEDGEPVLFEHTVEEGIVMMERQGKVMGNDAISIAKTITCNDNDPTIAVSDTSYTWQNKAEDGEVKVDVSSIRLGDEVALVGLKPETNALTELELWDVSPFKHTLVVSFLNGDQKYMPDAKSYELNTWEAKRAGMATGCAEEFVKVAKNLLDDILVGKLHTRNEGSATTGAGTTSKVEFGGITWVILEVKDGKSLIMAEDVLEQRAFHSAGGDVTWETSEIRAYLNGEFYNTTFSDAEKAKISESTITNASNSKYGIRGGNDTTDKVFLLSLQEAETYLFGFTNLLTAKTTSGEAVWWHLRSPGEALDVSAGVSANGIIDYHGSSGGVTDATGGVRPAMWVTLG